MVPVTFNHWPYHTDLLVFCLKCRFSPFCECLNYYYNITNNHWAILEKIQTEWFEDIRFWKKHGFITLPLEILDKAKLYANSVKLYFTPWKFQGQKWRLMEIQHEFFLISSGNSTSLSVGPSNFHMILFKYPWKIFLHIWYIYMQIYIQYICIYEYNYWSNI